MISSRRRLFSICLFASIAIVLSVPQIPLSLSYLGGSSQSASCNADIADDPVPKIDYRLYDMLEQPWGEWWQYRSAAYTITVSGIIPEFGSVASLALAMLIGVVALVSATRRRRPQSPPG